MESLFMHGSRKPPVSNLSQDYFEPLPLTNGFLTLPSPHNLILRIDILARLDLHHLQ